MKSGLPGRPPVVSVDGRFPLPNDRDRDRYVTLARVETDDASSGGASAFRSGRSRRSRLPSPMQHELVPEPSEQSVGWLDAPDRPGLGVDVDDQVVRRYGF